MIDLKPLSDPEYGINMLSFKVGLHHVSLDLADIALRSVHLGAVGKLVCLLF